MCAGVNAHGRGLASGSVGLRTYVVHFGIGGEWSQEFPDADDALWFAQGLCAMRRPPGWIDPCIEEIQVRPPRPGTFADIG